jgi:hypothetical protein
MMVVAHTTALSVLGAGLALRGPDGSMVTATDGLYEERKYVFKVFGYGLSCTVSAVVICVWLFLHWEAALICMGVSSYTGYKIYASYLRVVTLFEYDESETVDFTDIFDGPAAIRGVSTAVLLRRKGTTTTTRPGWKQIMVKDSHDEEDSPHSEEEFVPRGKGAAKKRGKGLSDINVV